jgi:hypothetical protein
MTFDPEQFLILARELIDDSNHDKDARYRTTVSRALCCPLDLQENIRRDES